MAILKVFFWSYFDVIIIFIPFNVIFQNNLITLIPFSSLFGISLFFSFAIFLVFWGGVFAFVSKDLGGCPAEKQGKSQKQKSGRGEVVCQMDKHKKQQQKQQSEQEEEDEEEDEDK